MRTIHSLLAAALGVGLTLAPHAAHADDADVDGDGEPAAPQLGSTRLGVGFEQTLGGVRGPAIYAELGPRVALQGVIGIDHGGSSGMYAVEATTVRVAARGIFPIGYRDLGILSAVAGLDVGHARMDSFGTSTSATHFALEGGLRGELFLTQWLSVNVEVGGVIDFVPDEGAVLSPERNGDVSQSGGTTIVSLDDTALLGGAGLTYWWR